MGAFGDRRIIAITALIPLPEWSLGGLAYQFASQSYPHRTRMARVPRLKGQFRGDPEEFLSPQRDAEPNPCDILDNKSIFIEMAVFGFFQERQLVSLCVARRGGCGRRFTRRGGSGGGPASRARVGNDRRTTGHAILNHVASRT